MDTLIHADIFFFVTTIAVVVVAAAFTVVLVYLAKVLRDVKDITAEFKKETMLLREDLDMLRHDVRREGLRLEHIVTFFKNLRKRKVRAKS